MVKLRDDENKKSYAKDKLKSVYSQLLDLDLDYSLSYVEWMLDKLIECRNHQTELAIRKQLAETNPRDSEYQRLKKALSKVLPKDYPNNLVSGDIVHVNFGVGFAGELSDGHYAVIISRKGSMYLIAPLTKASQPDGDNTVSLENLGLPGGVQKGYINLGQIRYVHFRRLKNIIELPNGRKHIAIEIVKEVLDKHNNIIQKQLTQ